MDFAYSSSGISGGILHLSPSHHHGSDPMAAIRRNLRQSLSRSPSKQRTLPRSPSSPPGHSLSPTTIQVTSPAGQVTYISPSFTRTISEEAGSNLRKHRLRRTTPLRFLDRSRAIRSPIRRALGDSNENSFSPPSTQHPRSLEGQENMPQVTSDSGARFSDTDRDPSGTRSSGTSLRLSINPTPFDTDLAINRELPIKSSPLKRSDGMMKLSRDSFDNPFVKRRTVQSIAGAATLEMPDTNGTDLSVAMEISSSEEDGAKAFGARPLFLSNASPFRRSLGQRPMADRNRRSVDVLSTSPGAKAKSKDKPRSSLDSAMPFDDIPDLFHEYGDSTTNRDLHRSQHTRALRQQPHPLSQTISPSSPTPARLFSTHEGVKADQAARSINFSKSLPLGALRPRLRESKGSNIQKGVDQGCSTPELYRMAKPNPAAFMSTGLISKKHRNVDDMPPPPSLGNQHEMPDTPCKKLPGTFNMPSSPSSIKSIAKPRFTQPEFGTPSKPFNPYAMEEATAGSFGRSVGIFGSAFFGTIAERRTSFASFEGEDSTQTLVTQVDGQSSADELPPTPTKQGTGVPLQKPNSLRSTLFGRRPILAADTFVSPSPSQTEFPDLGFGSSISLMPPPQTPLDTTFPDPSVLSISPISHTPQTPAFDVTLGGSKSLFPATPTGQQYGMTPNNRAGNHEVDLTLSSRFKKVEWYGRGEFSEVYRVYESSDLVLAGTDGQRLNLTPRPDKVWIVKKSKAPYTSNKVRERRLREAQIMAHLGKHEHVVWLQDSFEDNRHLYIQTEFCEEGSLHDFLARTGHKGRLDDFRIWKILIELAQGLKHIHDSSVIHLDLKPANIFIDLEGVLKIGDFGMASTWPAPPDVEGEGDRRYMGPDLLQGLFDKPADIFALGMVLFEIAGNVELPDNGVSWQKLRAGDFSDVPSLTSASSQSIFDTSVKNVRQTVSIDEMIGDKSSTSTGHGLDHYALSWECQSINERPTSERNELAQPPNFMLDSTDAEALDKVIKWMMSPDPANRPVVDRLLELGSVGWVNERKQAGAVIFEGQWGPPNHVLNFDDPDEEMLDI